jgi:hypothetical protein
MIFAYLDKNCSLFPPFIVCVLERERQLLFMEICL